MFVVEDHLTSINRIQRDPRLQHRFIVVSIIPAKRRQRRLVARLTVFSFQNEPILGVRRSFEGSDVRCRHITVSLASPFVVFVIEWLLRVVLLILGVKSVRERRHLLL